MEVSTEMFFSSETHMLSSDECVAFVREKGYISLNQRCDTALHFLAIRGNVAGFRALVEEGLLTREALAKKNDKGYTALHEAVRYGQKEVAEIMLVQESDLLAFMEDDAGETALYVAAEYGKDEVFRVLEDFGSDCFAKRNDGRNVLHAAIDGEHYSIPGMYVESETVVSQHNVRAAGITKRERPLWLRAILGLPWLRKIDGDKQKHGLALILAKKLISKEDWSYHINMLEHSTSIPPTSITRINPLIQATILGNTELISAILETCPQISDSVDKNGWNILHIAVDRKNLFLYEYLKKKLGNYKERMLAEVDKNGNTILHLAARVGGYCTFNHSSHEVSMEESTTDIARQMCWDVYWFKHTKLDCNPQLRNLQNKDGKTPGELFEENHLRFRKEAQRESIELINSIIVVATLFCTVNYAALFTVPGGFDQNSGLPVFDKNNTFYRFLLSVYIAIFCSFISLAALLSVQRAGFSAEEFYISLPLKAIAASICLLLSAIFTISASAQALVLESKRINSTFLLSIIMPVGYIIMIPIFIDMSYRIFAYLCFAILDLLFNM